MFPFYKQYDAMDCGPSCVRMIAKYYGKTYSLESLRERCYISREGVSLLGISEAAESIGFRTIGSKISFEQLSREVNLPCIVHWRQDHFIVVYKISKDNIYIADPSKGRIRYKKEEFLEGWLSVKNNGTDKGIALLLEPSNDFNKQHDEKEVKSGFRFLLSYFTKYKKYIIQLFFGMIVGSILQLIFPFLTQSIVDFGINFQDIDFIYLILIAQLTLFISRTSVEFLRNWIILHISTRINISLISDFLTKLMKLPVSFFEIKVIGDILQRIEDHRRIESFLTLSTLNILFSFTNLFIFGIILLIYNNAIFIVFVLGTLFYAIWVYLFLKARRVIDYKKFDALSKNQSNLIQLIDGMDEIKLNNCEIQKRWEWEKIQSRLFKINIKSLSVEQYQKAGGFFLNELKNIIITFLSATAVINGDMTLGMMLAVQYIIGQLNVPIEQIIDFMHSFQDAKLSFERINEIHTKDDEEILDDSKLVSLSKNRDIEVSNLSFQYEGPHSEHVLQDINLKIPEGKITAIVGMSGSGKTTLIKMLLGFYKPVAGNIKIGNINLENISKKVWRQECGVVMQDGFIFSDTIAKNISISDEILDREKLIHAVQVANIEEFIESLPLQFNTKIGADGHGLSQGQKQRLLIARAVYKNPEFIFFDEATNALDANNESIIMRNLDEFFKGKTVIVVAHRLSTVKNADHIVVLNKGRIAETGNHSYLTNIKGKYFNLVKNQLELGS